MKLMDKNMKTGLVKVFNVASFLFITIFFILPYLVQVSTYYHEISHKKALDKYGIENEYHVNLLETIPNFYNPNINKLGVTSFDMNDYLRLNYLQKTEVNLAGILSDLRFLFLISMFLTITNIYMFYKVKFLKKYDLTYVLAINWVLFMWLIALVQITVANVAYENGDIYQLVRILAGG